jgi:hypothetical protein
MAVKLYREMELYPGPSTQSHLLTQHGLRVGGPLFSNPAEGPASLVTAMEEMTGKPVVVKMLDDATLAEGQQSQQQPGGSEGLAFRCVLC